MPRSQILALVLIFAGGGLGSICRHAVNQASANLFGTNYPYGTLFVNVGGSLAIGLLAGWFAFLGESGQSLRLFLITGVLGGFTTFSAFSIDAVLLWERGQMLAAVLYVVGSVTAALLGVFLGLFIVRTSFN